MKPITYHHIKKIPLQDLLDVSQPGINININKAIIVDDKIIIQKSCLFSKYLFDPVAAMGHQCDSPVICEEKDVENAVSLSEYLTIQRQLESKKETVKTLQKFIAGHKKLTRKEIASRDTTITSLETRIVKLNKRSWIARLWGRL